MKACKFNKLSLLILIALILTACDSIPFIETTSDYKTAGRARPLEVPPDLTTISSSDAYSVPGGSTSYSSYTQVQTEQDNASEKVLANPEGVKMVKAGAQRWLVVNAPAEKVWPIIRDFWTEIGFAVRVENSQTGVMETEWVDAEKIKDSEAKNTGGYLERFDKWMDKLSGLADRRKFRTRLDHGAESGTTEIYMTHHTVAGAPDDGKNRIKTRLGDIDTGYRLDSNKITNADAARDDDIDAELLRRLMVKLGIESKRAKEIAANPVIEKRATISKEPDGNTFLALSDTFDRGWRRVGLALDRIGFVVEDKNRADGLYYVRYADVDIDTAPAKKKGLLETLKFWGNDKEKTEPEPQKNEKSLVDKLKFWDSSDKNKVDPEKQYRIKIQETESGTHVTVEDREGKRNRTSTANRIISLLHDQLK